MLFVATQRNNYSALKCTVAASFANETLQVHFILFKMRKFLIIFLKVVEQEGLEKGVSFQETDGGTTLTDDLAISWYISRKAQVYGLQNNDKASSEGLQWLQYGQSELRPYLWGYLYNSTGNVSRDEAHQAKQRARKLASLLKGFNEFLRSRTYLVGERLTLADTHLAIDFLPLFDVKLNGKALIKVVCPDNNLVNLKRWMETVVNQKSFQSVYKSEDFSLGKKFQYIFFSRCKAKNHKIQVTTSLFS